MSFSLYSSPNLSVMRRISYFHEISDPPLHLSLSTLWRGDRGERWSHRVLLIVSVEVINGKS